MVEASTRLLLLVCGLALFVIGGCALSLSSDFIRLLMNLVIMTIGAIFLYVGGYTR